MFQQNIYRAKISARVRLNLRTNVKQCKNIETRPRLSVCHLMIPIYVVYIVRVLNSIALFVCVRQ